MVFENRSSADEEALAGNSAEDSVTSAARVDSASLKSPAFGSGAAKGSPLPTRLVSMCIPTFSPAAWHLSMTAFRPASPWGKSRVLIGYEPSDEDQVSL